MATYPNFNDFKNTIKRNIERAVVEASKNLSNEVINNSPIDSGRFRGNWFASVNMTTTETRFNGTKTKYGTGIHFGIKLVTSEFDRYRLGDTIYLQNNLVYAQRLADGWSSQRPSGWIDTISDRFRAQLHISINGANR